ncbi:MAG: hypothetical protein ACLUAF_16855 [Paraclostridium sordellii]
MRWLSEPNDSKGKTQKNCFLVFSENKEVIQASGFCILNFTCSKQ